MNPTVFIYTALACEAKPLIAYFGLKKEISIQPFSVFHKNEICLVVTGLGKCAMAAGVAYTQAIARPVDNPVLLNIGVAGHRDYPLGTPAIIHKITDADTGKNFYPALVFSVPYETAAALTCSRAQLDYRHDRLVDMEASAFFETASRFTSAELIHCLKIVSDNKEAPADQVDARRVSNLIERNISILEWLLDELKQQSDKISHLSLPDYDDLVETYRFTASEKMQLKNMIMRWEVLTEQQPLVFEPSLWHKGKDVLRWLEQKLQSVNYTL